jgi:hypothetical protein
MPGVAMVIDAANVVGSRPDGWWRDRAGAAARLVAGLEAALRAGTLDGQVVVVLEGAARAGAPEGDRPTTAPVGARPTAGLRVVHAAADGDATIVAEVAALVAAGEDAAVVTADRGLRDRVHAAGGTVLPPSWLLTRLP